MEAESQIFSYALWSFSTFALVALWLAGLSDIWNSRRDTSFTRAKLAAMVVLLSLAAVVLFLVMEAVLTTGWQDLSPGDSGEYCKSPGTSYVFSFGLERDWC